jgi:predicted dienelactone hydrolase
MERESEQLERHIEETREQMGRNVEEIEHRVKSTFDWRAQFDKNPMLVLGIAFAGGAALAALLAGGGSGANFGSVRNSRFGRTWNNIGNAILAAATRRAETFLDEVLPTFREEYRTQRT